MASRTLAGSLGLKGDWALGEDGWKDENDLNLVTLSVLVQGRVTSKVAATPGAPAEGDVHIFNETHATQANKIGVYDEAAWKHITPLEGWIMYNDLVDYYERFNGTKWTKYAPGLATVAADIDNYTLAPTDVGNYIRMTAAGAKTVSIDLEATTALPADGEWHIRNVGAGDCTITPVVGVTVNAPYGGTLIVAQNGTVTIKRVAANTFDIFGSTIPL